MLLFALLACATEDAFVEGGITLGEVRACDSPGGLSYRRLELSPPLDYDPSRAPTESGYLAVADLDGDGLLDLVLPTPGAPTAIGWGLGEGEFAWTWHTLTEDSWQPSLVDLDRDGRLELLLSDKGGVALVRFEGREAQVSRLDTGDAAVREMSAGDLDGDGWPDLFPVTRGDMEAPETVDTVWMGGPEGLSPTRGLLPEGLRARQAFDGLWFDHEGDGDLDVFIVNDLGTEFGGNQLLVNEGGVLVEREAPPATGLGLSSMAGDAADFDGDGLADLYVTAAHSSQLLRALPDGGFVDVALSLGAQPVRYEWGMSWAAVWLDYDNDGALDLLITEGDFLFEGGDDTQLYEAPVHLLRQGDAGFEERGPELGLPQLGSHRAAVAADFNEDGVLDLLLTHDDAPPTLMLSEGCTAEAWLEVEGPVGAEVRVLAGGRERVGWIHTDSSFGAAKPAALHLGLGDVEEVDSVEVRLGGELWRLTGPLPARRLLSLQVF
ncbi:MAG: CRTAC1 family protein [Alphaproteobacteria bacterium]|nr:CRTAC1 family protein [Alphaproteobacteria bacterium]